MNTEEFIERFRLRANQWVDLDEIAQKAEAKRKRIYAEIVIQTGGAVSKAEYTAECHERYASALAEAIETKSIANRCRAEIDALEKSWETWRTKQATRRAEMNLR